jgi:hypothetical protein
MARPRVSAATRRLVFSRANHICEYCRGREDHGMDFFDVEHIIARAQGGSDNPENLALACGGCNGFKGAKLTSIDPETNSEASLFHPRQERWEDHFAWSDDQLQIVGLTPTGRATIALLQMNRIGLQNLRRALILMGLHPPT